jgi:hypothetical protein
MARTSSTPSARLERNLTYSVARGLSLTWVSVDDDAVSGCHVIESVGCHKSYEGIFTSKIMNDGRNVFKGSCFYKRGQEVFTKVWRGKHLVYQNGDNHFPSLKLPHFRNSSPRRSLVMGQAASPFSATYQVTRGHRPGQNPDLD